MNFFHRHPLLVVMTVCAAGAYVIIEGTLNVVNTGVVHPLLSAMGGS